jgi:hypothetical protein
LSSAVFGDIRNFKFSIIHDLEIGMENIIMNNTVFSQVSLFKLDYDGCYLKLCGIKLNGSIIYYVKLPKTGKKMIT